MNVSTTHGNEWWWWWWWCVKKKELETNQAASWQNFERRKSALERQTGSGNIERKSQASGSRNVQTATAVRFRRLATFQIARHPTADRRRTTLSRFVNQLHRRGRRVVVGGVGRRRRSGGARSR